jgi:hypothetical protein
MSGTAASNSESTYGPCSQCGADHARSRCPCHAASYCNGQCQRAHWKAGHKQACLFHSSKRLMDRFNKGSKPLFVKTAQPSFPRVATLAFLREAFPACSFEDWSDKPYNMFELSALHIELNRPKNHKRVVVVLREPSVDANRLTVSDQFFQKYGAAAGSDDMAFAAMLLVFHKDNYHYTQFKQNNELLLFMRRSLARELSEDCLVCSEAISLFESRHCCVQCGSDGVCKKCRTKIEQSNASGQYKCPTCRLLQREMSVEVEGKPADVFASVIAPKLARAALEP